MPDAFTLCQQCDSPIGGEESAHFVHDDDCNRFLNGFCRCEGGWVCASCCPDRECGPLAASLQEAREDTRAKAEAWEIAHPSPPAPPEPAPVVAPVIEHDPDPDPAGHYLWLAG